MPLKAAASRDAVKRAADRRVFETVRSLLLAGERLTPQKLLAAPGLA
ncbi:MAG: hypothetical protein H0W48_01740 [Methylibium sp.]|nr:hypothetical protein [Methylibium sp.]MBA2722057.1 hypothetical protein [Methylibium sp.]MBA3589761.1 hypothetical protein [Methylibium sp.]MBA3623193.1 hypothetical protein [Methylibium sp.]